MKTKVNINNIPMVYHYDCCSETMKSAISAEYHQESPELIKVIQRMAFGQIAFLKEIIKAFEVDAEIGHFVFDEKGNPKALSEYLDEVYFVREPQPNEVKVWARIGMSMHMTQEQFLTLVENGHLPKGVLMELDGDCYAPREGDNETILPEEFEDFSVDTLTFAHA